MSEHSERKKKAVMPIREQMLDTILHDFEKECDSRDSVSAGTHIISESRLSNLRTDIIRLISDEYL